MKLHAKAAACTGDPGVHLPNSGTAKAGREGREGYNSCAVIS